MSNLSLGDPMLTLKIHIICLDNLNLSVHLILSQWYGESLLLILDFQDCLYHHPVHKISFIAQDLSDSRAFGYIYGSPENGHRFFGIKTEKAASQVKYCFALQMWRYGVTHVTLRYCKWGDALTSLLRLMFHHQKGCNEKSGGITG